MLHVRTYKIWKFCLSGLQKYFSNDNKGTKGYYDQIFIYLFVIFKKKHIQEK